MANNRYSGPFRNYYESNKFYTVGGSASGEIVPIPGPIKTVSATTIQYINGDTTVSLALADQPLIWPSSVDSFTGTGQPGFITACIGTDSWQSGNSPYCSPTGNYYSGLFYAKVKIDTPVVLPSGTRVSLQHYGGYAYDVYKLVEYEKPPIVSTTGNDILYYNDKVLVDASTNSVTLRLPWTGYSLSGIDCFTVKKIDSSVNPVVISGSGGYSIDGQQTYTIYNQYETATFCHYESGNWYVY